MDKTEWADEVELEEGDELVEGVDDFEIVECFKNITSEYLRGESRFWRHDDYPNVFVSIALSQVMEWANADWLLDDIVGDLDCVNFEDASRDESGLNLFQIWHFSRSETVCEKNGEYTATLSCKAHPGRYKGNDEWVLNLGYVEIGATDLKLWAVKVNDGWGLSLPKECHVGRSASWVK